MATRKIKDAKDLSTNELIYFKSHAQATYMSDGRTVEEVINGIPSGSGSYDDTELRELIDTKQDELVSGENIKTINGESILGNGNITVSGNSSESVTKADLVYAVSKSASQGRLTDPGYYYFNSPTTIDFGSVNQYPRGIYSIVIDGFSTWPLTALYPLNFIWTNGEPDFASFAGTTKVLEISLFVLDDDNSYKKVLATWALFNF